MLNLKAPHGGVSIALTVSIYNVCAPIFGGITFELKAQRPPRKSKDEVDID